MARFGVLCPAAAGHANPMSILARELIARGHSIVFIGLPDVRTKLDDDFEFLAFGEEQMPAGRMIAFIDRLAGVSAGQNEPELMIQSARIAEIGLRELPRVLEAARVDALIVDQIEPAAPLVARAMGIPFATVANAFHVNAEPAVPPPVTPWPYDPTQAGIQRNLATYRAIGTARQPLNAVLRGFARRSGIKEHTLIDQIWSDICQVTQCPPSFDFPRQQLPAWFHYCGPFRKSEPPLEFELPDDGRPLVFCSLGSLLGSRAQLFHKICVAASELGLNLLIAHGGKLSDEQVAALPGKPIVQAFVPQRAVLAHCALAVTHAGLNTVLDALSCGTPMVALPIAFEQPGIAARIRHSGAGEVLFHERSAPRIKAAMQQVLARESYRANARRLADEIARLGGAKRAADLIEQAFGLRGAAAASEAAIPAQS